MLKFTIFDLSNFEAIFSIALCISYILEAISISSSNICTAV